MVDRASVWTLRAHLAVVLLAGGALVLSDVTGDDAVTADIGAGLRFLVLLVLALPWSLVLVVGGPLLGTAVTWPAWLGDLVLVLLALVNVGLHLAVARRSAGRPVPE